MLFNIEYDSGTVIEGYCVPDGFSDESKIRVCDDAVDIALVECTEAKDGVRLAGRHDSGLVGFRLDEDNVPGIPEISNLTLHDAGSGLMIYRRPRPTDLPAKVLRLEPQLLPLVHLDLFCGQHFQYSAKSVERFGHETVMQVFHLNAVPSIYLSGRLLLRNYEEFLDKGFMAIACLPDPYFEMASRIYLLDYMNRASAAFLGDRDQVALGPAADHFNGIKLTDRVALRRALRSAPRSVTNVLRSPLTRRLVCSSDDQILTRRDVAPAMDMLSRFSILGLGGDSSSFLDALAELLAVPAASIPQPTRAPTLLAMADLLRSLPETEALLEEDLILDHYVREAIAVTEQAKAAFS